MHRQAHHVPTAILQRQLTHRVGINNNHEITTVPIRAKCGFVLSLQNGGHGGGESPNGLGGCIHQVPCSLEGEGGEAHGRDSKRGVLSDPAKECDCQMR